MKKAAQAIVNNQLINERLQRRWLQKDVANLVGTTPINVCRWERGITAPGAYFRHQLCALYGKSEEELGFLPEQISLEREQQKVQVVYINQRENQQAVSSELLTIYVVFPS